MMMITHAHLFMSTNLTGSLTYFKILGSYTLMMIDYQVRFSNLNSKGLTA